MKCRDCAQYFNGVEKCNTQVLLDMPGFWIPWYQELLHHNDSQAQCCIELFVGTDGGSISRACEKLEECCFFVDLCPGQSLTMDHTLQVELVAET